MSEGATSVEAWVALCNLRMTSHISVTPSWFPNPRSDNNSNSKHSVAWLPLNPVDVTSPWQHLT